MMKINCLWILSLVALICTHRTEQLETMAECHPLHIEPQQFQQMTNEQQETFVKRDGHSFLFSFLLCLQARSILDQYDRNLTSIAYITSASEYDIHLFLNDSSRKQITVSDAELDIGDVRIFRFDLGETLRSLPGVSEDQRTGWTTASIVDPNKQSCLAVAIDAHSSDW